MRLGNRYVLGEPIASGGMAQVWTATDTVLDRTVAAKVLHPHLATDAAFVQRFRREAVAAARLSHRSIVSIYDTISANGLEAIVMELIDGRTLRAELDERGPLDPGQAAALGSQIAGALDAAHQAGIVHRDIKPANIMLCDDGRVFVTDFGIAKAGTDADLTTTGTLLGTAKYLSPEQVEGEVVDARSDLYSLGIVLFEALTGQVPFRANTDAATALARLHQAPPRVRQLRADVPPPLEDVVTRLMARRPDGRYPRASAVAEALEALGPVDGPGRPLGTRSGRASAHEEAPSDGGPSAPVRPDGGADRADRARRDGGPAGAGNEERRPVDDVATQHYPAPGTWLSGPPPAGPLGGDGAEAPSGGSVRGGGAADGGVPDGTAAPATRLDDGSQSGDGVPYRAVGPTRPGHPRPPDPPSFARGADGPPGDPFGGFAVDDVAAVVADGRPLGWQVGSPPIGTSGPPDRVVRRRRRGLGPVVGALVAVVVLVVVASVVTDADGVGDQVNPLVSDGPGLAIVGARSFDPESLDEVKEEREDLVPLAFDGDPSTAWQTEIYRRPALAGLKSGVGLQLELAESLPLNRIELDTPSEGWVAEIYVGDGFEAGGDWGDPAVTLEGGGEPIVGELGRAEGRVVLLWLRDPGVTGGRYMFVLSEVVLR
ncbi:MAG: protein kinase [Acidimicrobiales bacterium]